MEHGGTANTTIRMQRLALSFFLWVDDLISECGWIHADSHRTFFSLIANIQNSKKEQTSKQELELEASAITFELKLTRAVYGKVSQVPRR